MKGAFVTGGTAGIGRACVERLAADGYGVCFTGRDADRGAAVAAATGATFIAADARDRAASDAAVERAVAILGRLDAVVVNAGHLVHGPIAEASEEVLRNLFEVHLTNPFRTGRAAIAALRAAGGGSIVVISSECAIRGSHRLPAYSVAKAGSAMLAELFGAELARDGIRANALCPTNTLPGMAGDDPATWKPTRSGTFPSGADIANAVAWLCSDEARHVSGATIRIDGANGAAMILPPAS